MPSSQRPRPRASAVHALHVAVPDDLATFRDIDADAAALFDEAGLHLELPDDHEFPITERNRWLRCIFAGNALLATDARGVAVGFAALGERDGEPYLQQLSVRRQQMGQGIGGMLLEAAFLAVGHAGASALWLTTYDHLPWNRPFYQRRGFVPVAEVDCGAEILRDLEFERRWLPLPERRVVMRRTVFPLMPGIRAP